MLGVGGGGGVFSHFSDTNNLQYGDKQMPDS